jgi:molybdate transport system substrate-binding protein
MGRRRLTVALAALPPLLLLVACSGEDKPPELLVGAASSLQILFDELEPLFEANEEIELRIAYNASGTLAHQIEQGAPIDVFASADAAFVSRLAAQGLLVQDCTRTFGEGFIVPVRPTVPPGQEPVELLTDAERIAIANPEIAPYGAAAKRLLEVSGVWEELEDRIVYAETALQVLQFVKAGEVDFGFVPASLVIRGVESVEWVDKTMYGAPPGTFLTQTAAVVSSSERSDEGRKFVEFLASTEVRGIIARSGYLPVTDGTAGLVER